MLPIALPLGARCLSYVRQVVLRGRDRPAAALVIPPVSSGVLGRPALCCRGLFMPCLDFLLAEPDPELAPEGVQLRMRPRSDPRPAESEHRIATKTPRPRYPALSALRSVCCRHGVNGVGGSCLSVNLACWNSPLRSERLGQPGGREAQHNTTSTTYTWLCSRLRDQIQRLDS